MCFGFLNSNKNKRHKEKTNPTIAEDKNLDPKSSTNCDSTTDFFGEEMFSPSPETPYKVYISGSLYDIKIVTEV